MAGPIYSLYLGKPTEAWYQLSEDERKNVMAKWAESFDETGGKNTLHCNSRWSSHQWNYFGVHEFPNIEAVQKHEENLGEFNFHRYFEGPSVLGTA
jgi:hypothetical protein